MAQGYFVPLQYGKLSSFFDVSPIIEPIISRIKPGC